MKKRKANDNTRKYPFATVAGLGCCVVVVLSLVVLTSTRALCAIGFGDKDCGYTEHKLNGARRQWTSIRRASSSFGHAQQQQHQQQQQQQEWPAVASSPPTAEACDPHSTSAHQQLRRQRRQTAFPSRLPRRSCPAYLSWQEGQQYAVTTFGFGFFARAATQFAPVAAIYGPYDATWSEPKPGTIPVHCPFVNNTWGVVGGRPRPDQERELLLSFERDDETVQRSFRNETGTIRCHLAWLSMCGNHCGDMRSSLHFRDWPVLLEVAAEPNRSGHDDPTCQQYRLDLGLFNFISWEGKFDVYCSIYQQDGRVYGPPAQVMSFQTRCSDPPPAAVETQTTETSNHGQKRYENNIINDDADEGDIKGQQQFGDFPLVSALIVTFHRPVLLNHSVVELLTKQTYPAIEALIVDDSPTCESNEIVEYWRSLGDRAQQQGPGGLQRTVTYLCMNQLHRAAGADQDKQGIAGAVQVQDGHPPVFQWSIGAKRHYGVMQAAGRFVVHWDDDDWYAPQRLAYQVLPMIRGLASITILVTHATMFMGVQLKERHDAQIDMGGGGGGDDGDGALSEDVKIAGEPGRLLMFVQNKCPPVLTSETGMCSGVMFASMAYDKHVYDGDWIKFPFTSLSEDAALSHMILPEHPDVWLPNRDYAIYVRHSSSAFDSDVVLSSVRQLDSVPVELLPTEDRLFYEAASKLPEVTELRRPINPTCPFGHFKGTRGPFGIC